MKVNLIEIPEGSVECTTVVVRDRQTGEVFPANVAVAGDLTIDTTTGNSPQLTMLMMTLVASTVGVERVVEALDKEGYDLIIEDEECITPSSGWNWEDILNG